MGRGRFLGAVLSILAGVLMLSGCGDSGPGGDGWVEITSDSFFVFTEVGQKARIRAVVRRGDGSVVDGASFQFESSAPEVVWVNKSGELTAASFQPGSAVISVSSGKATPATVVAAIAGLTPQAVLVSREDVIAIEYPDPDLRDRALVTLRRNAATGTIDVGTVLFGGHVGGLLDRVIDVVEDGGGRRTFETVPATLLEVFEELDVIAEGPPIVFDVVLDDDGTRVVRSSRDGSQAVEPPPDDGEEGVLYGALSLPKLKCKGETSVVNVGFSGFQLEQRLSLRAVAEVRIVKGWFSSSVEQFDFYLRGSAGITGSVGEVSLSGGLTGKLECVQELGSIPFAFIPILGPIGIAPVLKPEVGVGITVGYTAGEVKLTGPKVDKGIEVKLGFGYASGQGFYPIKEREDVGEGVTLGKLDGGMKHEFKIQVEPFFRGVLAKSIQLAHWELLSAKTVGLKLFAGTDLALALPFDPNDRQYKGPEWNVYAGVSADLSPLMETLSETNKLLSKIGLGSISSIDIVLFQYKRMLMQSPRPRLQASPRKVTIAENVTLRADAINADGLRAAFVAFPVVADGEPQPPPRKIVEVTMPADGIARQNWAPKEGEDGTYDLNVHLYDSFFGAIGLPYALNDPTSLPRVEVLVDTSLTIDPPGIEDGDVGRQYAFTLAASRIPSELTEVRFEWDFGDGTTDAAVETVSGGRSQTVIRHEYTLPGTYILTAVLVRTDTGEQIADARAQVSVGTRLTIVPSFLAGDMENEYPFTMEATGLPSGVGQVTFQWNFGDGSPEALGQQVATVQGGRAGFTVFHRFVREGSFGVYAVVQAGGDNLASGTAMVVIGEVPEREYDLTICNSWKAAGSGGSSGTIDTWDISDIPKGAVFDLRFDAYSIPDMFLADYPDGMQVVNTGWRGESSYEGNPRYPGGIAGPGSGSVNGLFTKGKNDTFTVRVIGGEPGTAWDYQVSCRISQ